MAGALTWGDRDRFDRHLAAYAEVAARTRAPIHELLGDIDRAGAATIDGDYQQAADQLAEASLRSRPSEIPRSRSTSEPPARRRPRAGPSRSPRGLARRTPGVDRPAHAPLARPVRVRPAAGGTNAPRRHRRQPRAAARPGSIDVTSSLQPRRPRPSLHATAGARLLLPWAQAELRYGLCVVWGPMAGSARSGATSASSPSRSATPPPPWTTTKPLSSSTSACAHPDGPPAAATTSPAPCTTAAIPATTSSPPSSRTSRDRRRSARHDHPSRRSRNGLNASHDPAVRASCPTRSAVRSPSRTSRTSCGISSVTSSRRPCDSTHSMPHDRAGGESSSTPPFAAAG